MEVFFIAGAAFPLKRARVCPREFKAAPCAGWQTGSRLTGRQFELLTSIAVFSSHVWDRICNNPLCRTVLKSPLPTVQCPRNPVGQSLEGIPSDVETEDSQDVSRMRATRQAASYVLHTSRQDHLLIVQCFSNMW